MGKGDSGFFFVSEKDNDLFLNYFETIYSFN